MKSIVAILITVLIYQMVEAQRQPQIKCQLPENIDTLPSFAQDEIRAVWKNYVPGDDCKQELIITDDIFAVLEMLDKDIGREQAKLDGNVPIEVKPIRPVTDVSTTHETLIPTMSLQTDLTVNNTFPTLQSIIMTTTSTTVLPPIVHRSDTVASPPPTEALIDYGEFTTTSEALKVEPHRYTVSNEPQHSESSEQPFAFTGSPSATFLPETAPTTRIVLDYAEPNEEPVTSRVVRIMKVRIPTDYEEFEKQKHTNGYVEHKKNLKAEKTDKVFNSEKFYESQEPPMPFLKGASPQVVRLFKEVFNDPDVVSEQRRQEEIHLLAVSYLNAKQLSIFNTWSSQRRKRIRAREQMLYPLSLKAREALKYLALTPDEQERRSTAYGLEGELRDELKAFAMRLREQHQTEALDEYRKKHA